MSAEEEEMLRKALEKINIRSDLQNQQSTGKKFDRLTIHEFIKALMISAIRNIDKQRDLQFGKWEVPCINIGGKADYTSYCLN